MEHKTGFKCPVKEGETVNLKCESIGDKGDGIFKLDGFVIIVPATKVDETYNIKIHTVRPRVAFGDVVESETKE